MIDAIVIHVKLSRISIPGSGLKEGRHFVYQGNPPKHGRIRDLSDLSACVADD